MKDFPKNGPENKLHEIDYGQFKKWFAYKTIVKPTVAQQKEFAEWDLKLHVTNDKKKEIYSELHHAKVKKNKAKSDDRKALHAHRDYL